VPLKVGRSKKVISTNIKELMKKPSKSRSKAINTLAKKQGITREEAKRKQAVAISLRKAGKPLRKKNK